MTQSIANDSENMKETKLPRRDWIVLPMISLLTICLLAGSTELIARRIFPTTEGTTSGESCMAFNDPVTGPRGIPNCACKEHIPEGQLAEYHFNSSGYRNDVNLGTKSLGTYRIVMIGTSVAAGFRVQQEKTFAALLPKELSRGTGRKIDLYNEGMPWRSPQIIAHNFNDVLLARPDMILWILTPIDIERTAWAVAPTKDDDKSLSLWIKTWHRIKTTFVHESLASFISKAFKHTRTATLLSDMLYASPSLYVKNSVIGESDQREFLKSEPSAELQSRIEEFNSNAAQIEDQARDAGIPLVAVLVPDRTQAAMISMMGECPKGFDPYKLDNELRSIIVSHGGTYIDILPDYRSVPNPQRGYFAIDGHPNVDGHATITKLLAKELTASSIPELRITALRQTELEQNK